MQYYDMIFKRKSVRRYDPTLHVTAAELDGIRDMLGRLTPLLPDIAVECDIVTREQTTCKFGEYCLLFYSQEKQGDLLNAGYMLEQLDLYLASVDIGACW